MILASVIDISINLLMVVHVVVSLLLILVVLMQRPKQEGLGAAFGGGVMDSFAGAGTTSFLQKGTVYLAIIFIVLSLSLAILIGNRNHQKKMNVPGAPVESIEEAPVVPELTPSEEVAPEPSLKEEVEQLKQPDADSDSPDPVPSVETNEEGGASVPETPADDPSQEDAEETSPEETQ